MTDIKWLDEPPSDGRSKYPAMLRAIKAEQLSNPDRRESWAYLTSFDVEMSARDLATRLSKTHDEFEFISRKGDISTSVFARLKDGVTE